MITGLRMASINPDRSLQFFNAFEAQEYDSMNKEIADAIMNATTLSVLKELCMANVCGHPMPIFPFPQKCVSFCPRKHHHGGCSKAKFKTGGCGDFSFTLDDVCKGDTISCGCYDGTVSQALGLFSGGNTKLAKAVRIGTFQSDQTSAQADPYVYVTFHFSQAPCAEPQNFASFWQFPSQDFTQISSSGACVNGQQFTFKWDLSTCQHQSTGFER